MWRLEHGASKLPALNDAAGVHRCNALWLHVMMYLVFCIMHCVSLHRQGPYCFIMTCDSHVFSSLLLPVRSEETIYMNEESGLTTNYQCFMTDRGVKWEKAKQLYEEEV